jgi:hypothetical protein
MLVAQSIHEPIGVLVVGRVWKRVDVEAWAKRTGRLK